MECSVCYDVSQVDLGCSSSQASKHTLCCACLRKLDALQCPLCRSPIVGKRCQPLGEDGATRESLDRLPASAPVVGYFSELTAQYLFSLDLDRIVDAGLGAEVVSIFHRTVVPFAANNVIRLAFVAVEAATVADDGRSDVVQVAVSLPSITVMSIAWAEQQFRCVSRHWRDRTVLVNVPRRGGRFPTDGILECRGLEVRGAPAAPALFWSVA